MSKLYLATTILLFYISMITDFVALGGFASGHHDTEFGIMLFLILLERIYQFIATIVRMCKPATEGIPELTQCEKILRCLCALIFLDFLWEGIHSWKRIDEENFHPTTRSLHLTRVYMVTLWAQYLNIHAMFQLGHDNAGLIVALVFEMLFFMFGNMEVYYKPVIGEKEIEVPRKETAFLCLQIFFENWTKLIFWGFFIQITEPKGVWPLVIVEFVVGFIVETTLQCMKRNEPEEPAPVPRNVNGIQELASNHIQNAAKEQLGCWGKLGDIIKKVSFPIRVGIQFAFYTKYEDTMINDLDMAPIRGFKKGNIPIAFRFGETLVLWIIALATYADHKNMAGFLAIAIITYLIQTFATIFFWYRKYCKKIPVALSWRETITEDQPKPNTAVGGTATKYVDNSGGLQPNDYQNDNGSYKSQQSQELQANPGAATKQPGFMSGFKGKVAKKNDDPEDQ